MFGDMQFATNGLITGTRLVGFDRLMLSSGVAVDEVAQIDFTDSFNPL